MIRLMKLVVAVATTFSAMAVAQTNPASTPVMGKIIMFRPAGVMGFGIACPIRWKEREVVELGRGKYAEWAVKPGRYILGNKNSSIEVSVDPGETRYVRCTLKSGMFLARADLQTVEAETFEQHSAEFEKKDVNPL